MRKTGRIPPLPSILFEHFRCRLFMSEWFSETNLVFQCLMKRRWHWMVLWLFRIPFCHYISNFLTFYVWEKHLLMNPSGFRCPICLSSRDVLKISISFVIYVGLKIGLIVSLRVMESKMTDYIVQTERCCCFLMLRTIFRPFLSLLYIFFVTLV